MTKLKNALFPCDCTFNELPALGSFAVIAMVGTENVSPNVRNLYPKRFRQLIVLINVRFARILGLPFSFRK